MNQLNRCDLLRTSLAGAALTLLLASGITAANTTETGHLTLRVEEAMPGMSYWKAPVPLTIAAPVTDGVGGAGVAQANFASPLSFAVDGSALRVGPDGITGKVTVAVVPDSIRGKTAVVPLTWTIQARRTGDKVTGSATCETPATKEQVIVPKSAVIGIWDPPATQRRWLLEFGLPWVGPDEGCTTVVLRSSETGELQVVLAAINMAEGMFAPLQSAQVTGTMDEFSGMVEIKRNKGAQRGLYSPSGIMRVEFAGRRVGRAGVVQVKAADGDLRFAADRVPVFAWPVHKGFRLGPTKPTPPPPLSAERDPSLVKAALEESLRPIFPKPPGPEMVWPGTGPTWSTMALARKQLMGIAPFVFDIKLLPSAPKYRARVDRTKGQVGLVAEATGTDPYALLDEIWTKTDIGFYRFALYGEGAEPLCVMHVTLGGTYLSSKAAQTGGPRHNLPPLPSWMTPLPPAARFQVEVTPKNKTQIAAETTTPWDPLTTLWAKIPVGENTITIRSLDTAGKPVGPRAWSAPFEKRQAFQGPYDDGPARPYRQAVLDMARWMCDHPSSSNYRGVTYLPPFGGGDSQIYNGSQTAVHAGILRFLLATDPVEKDLGLWVARNGGDHLLATMRNVGEPCTYKNYTALGYAYGMAFLRLHEVTGEDRWRQAAEAVAENFVKRQQPSGTWWMHDEAPKVRVPSEEFVIRAGLSPGIQGPQIMDMDASEVLWFLGRLRTQLKTDRFRDCEEKAYQWVMQNPVRSGIWMDQGDHSTCSVVPLKLTGRCCSHFALYLLDYASPERRDLKLVDELMRYAEERHVNWERTTRGNQQRITPNLDRTMPRECGGVIWLASRYAEVWAKLYRETKNPLHLAKARALADTLVRAQDAATGSIDVGMALNNGGVGGDELDRYRASWPMCAVHLLNYATMVEKQ